jgi:hypothetical protein
MGISGSTRGAYAPVPINNGAGAPSAADAKEARGHADAKEARGDADAKCGQCGAGHHGTASVTFVAKQVPAQFAPAMVCPRCHHTLRDSSNLWVLDRSPEASASLPVVDADTRQGGLCSAPTGNVQHCLRCSTATGEFSSNRDEVRVELCNCTHQAHWLSRCLAYPRKLRCMQCACRLCARTPAVAAAAACAAAADAAVAPAAHLSSSVAQLLQSNDAALF